MVEEENKQENAGGPEASSEAALKEGSAHSLEDVTEKPAEGEDGEGVEGSQDGGLSEGASELKSELEGIKVTTLKPLFPEIEFDKDDFPLSYRFNSDKEKLVLSYADNYRRQFIHLYSERKPLLLFPKNELGVEKFVSTTIRPTQLAYKELYDWNGAADFVADHLSYIPLQPEHELPERLLSPATVLKLQRGTCFEYSTVLASLLIGVGYDAYVVSGYVGRETSLVDQSYEICPLLIPKPPPPEKPIPPDTRKYKVKAARDLTSKYDMRMEAKRQKVLDDEKEKVIQAELERIRISELPPEDPLYGMRVHSWVLVLEGKRGVAESFYIEPTTGVSYPLDTDTYLGVESVWNHKNYWTNMQDCKDGVKCMSYDLGDCSLWEYIFPSNEPKLLLPAQKSSLASSQTTSVHMVASGQQLSGQLDLDSDDEEKDEDIEKHLDLPPSWTDRIILSPSAYETRCPQGRKEILYKRAKLEKFAPYLMKDGLMQRLSTYEDLHWTMLLKVVESYKNRADKLLERTIDYTAGWITECFCPGRQDRLKTHRYKIGGLMAESDRELIYYAVARIDGLSRIVESPLTLLQEFINREDCLVYRYVQFGLRPKKFAPAADIVDRPIEKITERFTRDIRRDADDDPEEIVYSVLENRTYVRYHKDRSKITASYREFNKPINLDDVDKDEGVVWSTDNVISFIADPHKKEKKRVELYYMMISLLDSETDSINKVRDTESSLRALLDRRQKEEAATELSISIFDTQRNDKALKHRAQLEKLAEEARLQNEDRDMDYIGPQILLHTDPGEPITRAQALKVREEALADLKQRLVEKANLIQGRFEKETAELQKRQQWYQQNQVSLKKSEEQEYLDYCAAAMFRIHILELRLQRHKEMAPMKYMALENQLRQDRRLAGHLE